MMLIIGEKLNSARKQVREMIENRDVKSIQDLAKKQVEGGADILDVNSSAASGNKEENMEKHYHYSRLFLIYKKLYQNNLELFKELGEI